MPARNQAPVAAGVIASQAGHLTSRTVAGQLAELDDRQGTYVAASSTLDSGDTWNLGPLVLDPAAYEVKVGIVATAQGGDDLDTVEFTPAADGSATWPGGSSVPFVPNRSDEWQAVGLLVLDAPDGCNLSLPVQATTVGGADVLVEAVVILTPVVAAA